MRPTFRKLEVKDIASLEQLVAENADGVEPGLKVIDSRLLLGQAAIDLVGLDSRGSLALIALDFSADDGLLLRVMDVYSWCLEYPDTLRRLYPMAQASSRPPRILFIVEKMTDAFLRRVKQLSFLEIDCFEFRHLEVNGAAVVYFDLVERLRKSAAEPPAEAQPPAPAPAATPVVAPAFEARVEPVRPAVERPTSLESREPVSEPKRVDPPQAGSAEPVRVEAAAVVLTAPEPAAPVAVAPSAPAPAIEAPRAVEAPQPVVEVQASPAVEYQAVKLQASIASPTLEPPAAMPAEPALALESIESTSVRAHTNGHAHHAAPAAVPVQSAPAPVEAPVIAAPVAAAPSIVRPQAPAVVVPQTPAAPVVPAEPAPVQATPVWAKPGAQPNGTRPQFFAQVTKSSTPVEAPAVVAAVAAAAPASQPAASKVGLEVDDRPELESLSFPKDGLSRQWLEFLSQLGATK